MKVLGQLEVAGLEQLNSDPTPAWPGRIYMNMTTVQPKIYLGAWTNVLTSYQQTQNDVINLGLAISVSSSAMTIALKQADGATDPTAAAPAFASFRSATAANGSYVQRSATAAASLVVPSGATLGMTSAVAKYLWVYLIDNGGVMELAICGVRLDDGSIQNSTAISAGSSSSSVLYSTTSRANKAIRLIGRMFISEATAGTWASLPTELTLNPKNPIAKCVASYFGDSTTYAGNAVVQWNNKIFDNLNAVVTGASWLFTVPVGHAGLYKLTLSADILSAATTGWSVVVNGAAYCASLNPVAGKGLAVVNGILLAEGGTIQIQATGALQMENSIPKSPNILIEQLEWA